MNKAFRLLLCLFLIMGWSSRAWLRVEAQSDVTKTSGSIERDSVKLPPLPENPLPLVGSFTLPIFGRDSVQLPLLSETPLPLAGVFTLLTLPTFQHDVPGPPFAYTPLGLTDNTVALLQSAILDRLGIRYRYTGSDNRGYDCSGFVWRVFRDAGAEFERVAARTLWRQLPEAKGNETRQFGTLVFFNGLKHIGIVRDAESFYHSSRSQGVVLSRYVGYWNKRLTGFRRSPMPVIPIPPEALKAAE